MNSKLQHLNCGTLGSFKDFTLDIYLPFPTVAELKEYDIFHFNCYRDINLYGRDDDEVKITESTLEKYKILMLKELQEEKWNKREKFLDSGFSGNSSYIGIELPYVYSSACENTSHFNADIEDDLQRYVKEFYPDTDPSYFEDIHRIDFGQDMELCFIKPKNLFGYEFFHLRFTVGLGAKLLIDRFRNDAIDSIRFYYWTSNILEDVDGFNERAGKDYLNLFDLRTYGDLSN